MLKLIVDFIMTALLGIGLLFVLSFLFPIILIFGFGLVIMVPFVAFNALGNWWRA